MKMNPRKAISFAVNTLLAAGMAGLLAGCVSIGPLARQQAALPKDKVDAPALFLENCSRCHGPDGRAHTFHGVLLSAQDLTSSVWQLDTDDDTIVEAIASGPGAMPAFGRKLSDEEIQALASYVRTFTVPK